MKKRMNGMDAFMIHSDQINAVMHTLKIAILDPSSAPGGWNYDEFREVLRAMPKVLPWTRWRYLQAPFGLHHPIWVEDPDFDIDYHIRRVACPAPGDNRTLCELIAQLYMSPLDHRRPLWMVWVIEGLEGGKVANMMLFHHAYADGTGAAIMMQRCYKPAPFRFALQPRPWNPSSPPTRSQLFRYSLMEMPGTLRRGIPRLAKGLIQLHKLKRRYVAEGREPPPSPFKNPRDTPMNDRLSACRSFAFEAWPLEEIRRISKHYGVTINDLFVACAAKAYRRLMIDRGADPDTGPLVAMIPFSRRPPPEVDDGFGNMTTVDYLSLPVHIADPHPRLMAAHEAGVKMKEHYREAAGADMSSVLDLLPGAAIRALSRKMERERGKRGGTSGNAIISNVRGPQQTLYLGQYKMDNWISTGQVVHGLAINTTAWSYAEKFTLCVLADRKFAESSWFMVDYFREALNEYESPTHTVSSISPTNLKEISA